MKLQTHFFVRLSVLALASISGTAVAERIVIHAGTLIDGRTGRATAMRSIVVEDDRIARIENGFIAPDGADRVIELTGHTVMPGLIDMHVHLSDQQSADSYEEEFRLDPADYVLRSVRYAERTLMAGFTTVRDLGTADGIAMSLRDAINQGWIVGPRIYTAGKSLATTGGHADPSNGVNAELAKDPGPVEGVVNGVEDAYKGVRARYKEGADLIKITATGGVLSFAASGDNAQFTIEEIEAIVAAASDYGFRVAAHAHGAEGIRRAVVGGVHSIEHGTYMTEEIMRLMKERGTAYVPTLAAAQFVADQSKVDGYFPEIVRVKAAAIGPAARATFATAYRSGVRIVFGTDTGVSPHGDNWKEFIYMHEAGVPVIEAIQAATLRAAELLGRESDVGTIEAGKLADIVAVPGDPLTNVELMGRVDFVMKAGVIHKAPGHN
jgi:imidazolonepropionase-like amidohydrolase